LPTLDNELFIGEEFINKEGRTIKHLGLVKKYAQLNINKIKEEKLKIVGLDLETNHITGELKLLGFYDGEKYAYYEEDFLHVIFSWIKYLERRNTHIAYWNRLDPAVLYKQFLLTKTEEEQYASMARFGKIAGKWDRKAGKWEIPPVIEIKVGNHYYGIENAVRSSIKFYYRKKGSKYINTVWAYDIAQLYEAGLEYEALGKYDEATDSYPNARLPYYTKMGSEFHKVDWIRYKRDDKFKEGVLYSNELDARAVYDLGNIIQDLFYEAFKYYPTTLVSSGSLARAAIVAVIKNKYYEMYPDNPKKADRLALEDINSIALRNHKDKIVKMHGGDFYKDFHCMLVEAYSGGYIESLKYGYAKEGYYADIASAYPAVIKKLYDLRNCAITYGKGDPPHTPYSYCIIRGVVDIPKNVNYHPITIKDTINKDTNIRATGVYRASYTINERDFLLSCGAKFYDEEWYNLQTEGILSPLAEVEAHLLDLRAFFLSTGNTAQYIAKKAANSGYGILFEAVDTYKEVIITREQKIKVYNEYREIIAPYIKNINLSNIKQDLKYYYDKKYYSVYQKWNNPDAITIDAALMELEEAGIQFKSFTDVDKFIELEIMYNHKNYTTKIYDTPEIIRAGYRGGEFLNELYALWITAETRIMEAKAAKAISENGGEPIVMMTDSTFWKGTGDMLPSEMYKDVKTVGYFEKPVKVKDIVCLGSGRYSYYDFEKGKMTSKRRGLNITDIHDPEGIITEYDSITGEKKKQKFSWLEALKVAAANNSTELNVNVRVLISVGIVLHNSKYTTKDLGRVVEQVRKVDLIVGKSKRFFDEGIKNPKLLATGLVDTEPKFMGYGMFGENDYNDQTLPTLRELVMKKKVETQTQKNRTNQRKASSNWNSKNRKKINDDYNHKYNQIRSYGYNSYEADKMAKWSMDRIMKQIEEDKRVWCEIL